MDRQFVVTHLKAALEELNDPNNRAAGLLALRDVAEAYGGLGMVAEQAGISREALYRSFLGRSQKAFVGDVQPVMQALDHLQTQAALAVQHFGDAAT